MELIEEYTKPKPKKTTKSTTTKKRSGKSKKEEEDLVQMLDVRDSKTSKKKQTKSSTTASTSENPPKPKRKYTKRAQKNKEEERSIIDDDSIIDLTASVGAPGMTPDQIKMEQLRNVFNSLANQFKYLDQDGPFLSIVQVSSLKIRRKFLEFFKGRKTVN